MNKFNIFALSAALVACVSSCELKDELKGDRNTSSEMGVLDLSVAVQGEQTRADGAAPAPEEMFVEVVGTEEGAEPVFEGLYSGMEHPMRVPVGTYTVSAHTQGEIQKQMSAPYYGGNEELTVTTGETSSATVTCKIMNTKIVMSYSEDLLANFSDWTITFDNGISGDGNTVTFTNENGNTPFIYWYLADEAVSKLTLNFTGTNTEGETISWQKTFAKTAAPEGYDGNENFAGGDVLDITLDIDANNPNPDEPDQPEEDNRGQLELDVTVNLTWNTENGEQTVEIPVEDVTEPDQPGGGEDPDQPDPADMPTMTMPSNGHITYTLNGGDQPASADVLISVPKGLKSMNVKIEAGNEGFAATISDLVGMNMDFVDNGVEMVGNALISSVLGAFLGEGASVSAPATGDTEYTFPVGAFFGLMNGFGATAPNAHKFIIVLEDQAGNKVEDELLVTINPEVE